MSDPRVASASRSASRGPQPTLESLVNNSEMGARIRGFNWAATPLGPPESWSPALRMMLRFLLANRFPLLLWWGPQYVSIYNDAYIPALGAKHPWALGQPVSECWKEIWHLLQPLIDRPFHGGPATWNDDIFLEINRHGFVEETHFTIAYSPVPDETVPGGIGGVLATVHEITAKVVAERRAGILRDLAARAADAKSAEEACRNAAETLGAHAKDVPFALFYLIDSDGKRARLAGSAGFVEGSPACPPLVELGAGGAPLWPLAEAAQTKNTQVVGDLAARLGQWLPPGPWSDPPREAVVTPIRSRNPQPVAGILVAGVSARLKLDALYQSFYDLLASQVSTAVANARAYEDEKRRAEALAELDQLRSQVDLSRLRQRATAELAQRVEELDKISAELRDSKEALSKNEERFRAYVMAGSDVVYSMSPDWKEMRYLQGKEFMADTLEPSAAWLEKYIHADDRPGLLAAVNDAVKSKSMFQLEHRVIRRDGTLGWTFSRAVPLLDDKGQIREWFGAASDVTQRKEAEEKLAALRRLYHAILSTTPDLAYVFDLQHRFTYANDALLAMWGKTWEQAIGKTCLELGYEPWHAEMHDREIEQVIATRQAIRGEVPFAGAQGRRIYEYIFMPVIGANGMVEAVAGTTRDVTERRQAAEKLEQMVADRTASLREAVEQMEEFSYSVSHDLRAPLRAINSYAGVLLEDYGAKLDDTARSYLGKIQRSSDRMNRLTQDVLTYSRVARSEVHLEPIALEQMVREIVNQYSHLQPPSADIEIASPLLDVLGHETTLGQCIANLLTNAVKFVAPGVKPRVKISTERRARKVRVWFRDNGIGITPEQHERIFRMFERLHPEGKYEGTGIGLTIVRKAVEKMGGAVGVESDGQNGSSFWIELRRAEA